MRQKYVSILIFYFCFFLISKSFGQTITLRKFNFPAKDCIILRDSFIIEPQSIKITSLKSPFNVIQEYTFIDSILFLHQTPLDSFSLSYRVIPIYTSYTFSLFDTTMSKDYKTPDYALPDYYKRKNKNDDWWDSKSLNYSGNFSRGLSIGNAQSLVFNSNLNLQIQGDLGDGIKLTAAISDNQIPIQAEGNTRQLNEFDKLYIQLEKNKTKLLAGDYELLKPNAYFQNYFKKNKGISISHEQKFTKWNSVHKASAAISKGKSNRMNIIGQNGNQGPYRLSGKDGENFIIILSGSEKIWWDGNLLERGEDADYTIDYNLAELRFTTRRLVSNVARIIIEFEYADQNYTRSLFVYNTELSKGPLSFYLNTYREQDSKKPAIQNDLDSLDKIKLAEGGDNSAKFFRSGARVAGSEFSKNRVYYSMKDTFQIIQNQKIPIQIFQYNALADSSDYSLGFSELGTNKGSYILKLSNANGRVYEWVADDPNTGEKRGKYEPLVPIIPPTSFNMISLGAKWEGKAKDLLHFELTTSHLDKNRLSNIDDQDNNGFALKIEAQSKIFKPFSSKHEAIIHSNYEWTDNQFRYLQPFRNTEFNRDWNISTSDPTNDHYAILNIENKIGKKIKLNLNNSLLSRSRLFNGIRNGVMTSYSDSLSFLQIKFDILNSSDSTEKTIFARPNLSLERKISKHWKSKLILAHEQNSRRHIATDTLRKSSFSFDILESNIENNISDRSRLKFNYQYRLDRSPEKANFENYSRSHEFGANYQTTVNKSGSFEFQMSSRVFTVLNSDSDSLNKNTLLGFIDHQIGLLHNSIKLKNNYQISSGLEPRLEFIFEELRPGQGDYIYRDFNGDGIRQNQEFILAPDVDSAQFIRIQLFNSDYYQVYEASWNNFFSIDLSQIKSIKNSFLKKISLDHILRLQSKQNENTAFIDRINPFYFLKKNNSAISYINNTSQNLYFNRANPIYDIQIGAINSSSRLLYTSGNDDRKNQEYSLRSRSTFYKQWDVIFNCKQKQESHLSEYYELQNYLIKSIEYEPEIVYRYSLDIRFKVGAQYKIANEKLRSFERAEITEIFQESLFAFHKKFSIRNNIKYIKIGFDGKPGTALEFSMLEGYKDGNNFSWELNFDYRMNKLIQLGLSYSGRKSANSEPFHTGRATMRAIF